MSQYKELKERVYEANIELNNRGLVLYSFGNVSEIDRDKNAVAIKPSGVPYEKLNVDDIVIVDLQNNIIEGKLQPSSDTKTHTYLYRQYKGIGGVAHTHSTYATGWAQAAMSLPCYGTTHADYCNGEIPCTKSLEDFQINGDYEEETGVQIGKTIGKADPLSRPMILVAGHGPFSWGVSAENAVYHLVVLEEIAHMNYITKNLNNEIKPLNQNLINKHYDRKHGANAYYGQR
jgi:L-ribulose-5-phosphate 4-epimerase